MIFKIDLLTCDTRILLPLPHLSLTSPSPLPHLSLTSPSSQSREIGPCHIGAVLGCHVVCTPKEPIKEPHYTQKRPTDIGTPQACLPKRALQKSRITLKRDLLTQAHLIRDVDEDGRLAKSLKRGCVLTVQRKIGHLRYAYFFLPIFLLSLSLSQARLRSHCSTEDRPPQVCLFQ
jgi:hypothetical protein